jgi:hypothetical protein
MREPQVVEGVISSASSGVRDAPSHSQQPVQKPRATTERLPGWLGWARWTARILGTLILLSLVPFVLAEGLPPFATQPEGVQLTSAGAFLILLGFVVGWWREGTAAVLIALGWTVVRTAEIDLRLTTPFEIALLVSLLYAFVWWATQGRKTVLAGSVAATLALGLVLGRLFAPTGVYIEG